MVYSYPQNSLYVVQRKGFSMKCYLGIDSGGTKTKFLLVDENGHKLAESNQSASHYLQVGYDGLKSVLQAGLQDCLNQSACTKESIHHIFASVAGYGDIEDDSEHIIQAVNEVFYPIQTTIGNDVENAYAGGLVDKTGIVLIAGTGSIGLGLDNDGNSLRCGGWHHIFGGDEGSGYWIGCKLIQEFTMQSDGRSNKTQLYSHIKTKFNFVNDSDILKLTVVDWDFDRTKVAALSREVSVLAHQNDPASLRILNEAAVELSRIIIAIKNQLNFSSTVLASYQGGVFKSGDPVLIPLKEILIKHNIELIPPFSSPDIGSVILAFKYAHTPLTETILRNLKA